MRVSTAVLAKGFSLRRVMRLKKMVRRNRALHSALSNVKKPDFVVDHVVFHEGNISRPVQWLVQIFSLPMRIRFVSVDQFFKTFKNEGPEPPSCLCPETDASRGFSLGYKMMCAFWSYGFFDYFRHHDVVMRVDDDCEIIAGDFLDILAKMSRKELDYVTPAMTGADHPDVTRGLSEFAERWYQDHPYLRSPVFDVNPYTNVFLLRLDAFRKNVDVMAFLQAVRDTGCIRQNRWGDLPVWGVLLALHADQLVVAERGDIEYRHGSHAAVVKGGNVDMPS